MKRKEFSKEEIDCIIRMYNDEYKGTPFNTSGWTSVEVVGQIIDKIGPILATKYNEVN